MGTYLKYLKNRTMIEFDGIEYRICINIRYYNNIFRY